MWHSPSISSIATHPLPDILTLTVVPLTSKCVQRHTNAGHFILSAVFITIGFSSPPPHTLMVEADLKTDLKTAWEDKACRKRQVLAPAENSKPDTNRQEKKRRGTAPSGPDTTPPASGKTNSDTGNKMFCHQYKFSSPDPFLGSDIIHRKVFSTKE